jgi:hypothetical protein
MAPDISKIDPDRYPNLGASPWYFRDEVLRMPFHPHSLSVLQSDRLIPVFGKFIFYGRWQMHLSDAAPPGQS